MAAQFLGEGRRVAFPWIMVGAGALRLTGF
jgi:hypothetical protein